jgi:hypothetical protein
MAKYEVYILVPITRSRSESQLTVPVFYDIDFLSGIEICNPP